MIIESSLIAMAIAVYKLATPKRIERIKLSIEAFKAFKAPKELISDLTKLAKQLGKLVLYVDLGLFLMVLSDYAELIVPILT
ncbi:hypothetical protein [Vibrio parahaemolyticus]|uniref:hypothetical protein n=1 Tax=Vibrio parahaemolyticus TaxID=670 RepID=UPI0009458250|nr:hypothetical protein [Vibrio parahaemolyticus]OKY33997.1 hypothetical protein BUE73_21795 [Vibrio parahaemolyticus]OKY34880.1 hypothetical protein BUE11_21215 [Vibrio parahaemolyticus]RFD34756.1 hypothetical protein BKD11_05025 [Vibrio parahaemolyticus]HCE2666384.1 hypothetical protein [Vibrio parahaemolyticus]HCE2839203.1 hypothetical protein [Vibrio parahaemolyticus]